MSDRDPKVKSSEKLCIFCLKLDSLANDGNHKVCGSLGSWNPFHVQALFTYIIREAREDDSISLEEDVAGLKLSGRPSSLVRE